MLHSILLSKTPVGLASPSAVAKQLLADVTTSSLRNPVSRARALQRTCRRLCEMHALVPRLRGALPGEPVIFVSNNLGYLDPLLVCGLVPCSPIVRSEVRGWPLIGAVAEQLNVIHVERAEARSVARALRAARRRLESGVSVLSFPAATTPSGPTREFEQGVFGLAMLTGVPVVPLAISVESPDPILGGAEHSLGRSSRSMLSRQRRFDLGVGPKMYGLPRESAADFARRVFTWIDGARDARSDARPIAAVFESVPAESGEWSKLNSPVARSLSY